MFTSHQPVIKLDQNDILLGVIVDSKRKNERERVCCVCSSRK